MLALGSMRQEVGIHFHKECTGAIKWLALHGSWISGCKKL